VDSRDFDRTASDVQQSGCAMKARTVVGLHQRHLEMSPEDDHFTLRDAAKVAAAE
jgi:hypothetical protein